MNKNKFPLSKLLFLLAGEAVASVITAAIYILLDQFSYRVIVGLLLGTLVAVGGFLILCIAVNRAVDKVMAERGEGDMDEEQAAEFAAKHSAEVNKAVRLAQIGRTLAMLAVLVPALLTDWFDVIATLVPLVAFQPLLMLGGLFFDKEG